MVAASSRIRSPFYAEEGFEELDHLDLDFP